MAGAIIVHPKFLHTLHQGPEVRTLEECGQDVLQLIAQRFNRHEELCSLQMVSKSFRKAGSSEELWKQLCMSRFAVPGSCSPPSWQQLYRFNYEFLYRILLSRSAEQFASGFSRTGTHFLGMGIAVA